MFKHVRHVMIFSIYLATFTAALVAAPQSKPFNHPLVFEPNQGQVAPEVKWLARGGGYRIFITADSATFALLENSGPADARISVVRMKLGGSGAWHGLGLEPTGGVSNYFVGNDPKQWRNSIPHYGRLRIPGVYPGIDLVFYDHNGDLEYDFILTAGADPKQIRLQFEGADRMFTDETAGDLVLTTATGAEFRTHRPRVFQESATRQMEVAGAYEILDHAEAAFALASYDVKRPLLIDPTVTFTTFFHGSAEDIATGIAVDNLGNAYVSGWTFSSDFPVVNSFGNPSPKACAPTPGRLCATYAFVAKLSSTGTVLFFTYLGGNATDIANAVAADSTGVYVAGITYSTDFPTYFATYKGKGADVFVTKLSTAGALIYSSVFGGTNTDEATGIAVDSSQSVYITGKTKSTDYPVSYYRYPAQYPPMQKSLAGVQDAFVTKLDPNGLLYGGYSTYLGGSADDEGAGIAIDGSGFAYVTGITFSNDFPTVGPTYGSPNGNGITSTAFVTKLVPNGSGVLYSLTLGGGSDEGNAIAVGSSGNAYITGDTASTNFPTTTGALQKTKPSPQVINKLYVFDGFVSEISAGGVLLASTYLGATDGASFGRSIALNNNGDVYVAGDTFSTNFVGPWSFTPNPTAGYLVKLPASLGSISFRMFLGAQINSIAIQRPTFTRTILSSALTATEIYTAGFRYVPGSDTKNPMNVDAFAVKVEDAPVSVIAR